MFILEIYPHLAPPPPTLPPSPPSAEQKKKEKTVLINLNDPIQGGGAPLKCKRLHVNVFS